MCVLTRTGYEYRERDESKPGVPKVPRGCTTPSCTHMQIGPGGMTWLSYGGAYGGSSAGSCNLIPTMHRHKKTRRKDHRGFVACSAPRLRKGQGWTHWLRHFSLLGSAFGIFVANTGENIWYIGILIYLYLIVIFMRLYLINISMRLYMIITVMYLHIILIFCLVFCAC